MRKPDEQGGAAVSDELRAASERALQGNLEKEAAKLERQGKLFVRDRLPPLLADGSFLESALLANALARDLPADGVVTGVGTIGGRPVAVMANDPTVKAGSWGARTVEKIVRLTERALSEELPVFWLVDSAGARITDQVELFPGRRGAGRIFANQVRLSGRVPQVCCLFGPSAAGGACRLGRRPRVVRTSPRSATSCSWSSRTPRCTSARRGWRRRSSARTPRSRRWAARACTPLSAGAVTTWCRTTTRRSTRRSAGCR